MIPIESASDLVDESVVESPKNSHDLTSFQVLNMIPAEHYPKKSPVCDDELMMKLFSDTVSLLSGEYVCFVGPSGKLNTEILVLTNYRLCLLMNDAPANSQFKSFINVPIMIVESIEIKEIVYIFVYLKNAKTIR
jgi:hypothetical protein